MTTGTVKTSTFVKRQTAQSGFSHYDGTWEELEALVESAIVSHPESIRQGYRTGVILVDLPAAKFYSAIVRLEGAPVLNAKYLARNNEEAPYIQVSASGNKQQAKHASVVLYSAEVLEEDKDRSTDAQWEIIAIKARVEDEEEPMPPMTMARNYLHLKGGTKGDFTAEDFARSIVYWNSHAMVRSEPWYKRWFRR